MFFNNSFILENNGFDGIGINSGNTTCYKEEQEQFNNPYFDCGLDDWQDNSYGGVYSGTLTDNGDGTVTLVANDDTSPAYYSIEPSNRNIEAGQYLATVEVTSLAATNGWKMSYHLAGGTWGDALSGTTAERAEALIDIGATDNWNIGHNNAVDGDSITFSEISLIKVNTTESPCMSSYTDPYGVVEASHELSGYNVWKGFNCTRNSGSDAWLTPMMENGAISPENEEVKFSWYLTDADIAAGMPLMIPTEIVIYPRAGMNTAWYTDHNPYRLRIKGIADDMTEFIIMDEYYTDDWTGNGSRTIDLTNLSDILCRGISIYILGTRAYESGGSFHSGWGFAKFYGIYGSGGDNLISYNGEAVEYNSEYVTRGD